MTDKPVYTSEQLRDFDEWTNMASSQNQMERISGRLRINEMEKQLGYDTMKAMWEAIQKQDAKKGKKT